MLVRYQGEHQLSYHKHTEVCFLLQTKTKSVPVSCYWHQARVCLSLENKTWWFEQQCHVAQSHEELADSNQVLAPMPGKLSKLAVSTGDHVAKGELLCALEAMKMEHSLVAQKSGVVQNINYQLGDLLEAGTLIMELT